MASSMQQYLKRYASEAEKPKKKKKKPNALKGKGALTIVDADPVWQKDIKEASSDSEPEQGDAPLVIEDVEFKRMQRLEVLRKRPYIATAADGSGWVSLNETLNQGDAPLVIEDVEFKRMQRLEVLSADGSGLVSLNETLNQGDAPLVIEDVEFKRMHGLEVLSADGSGLVSLNETLNQGDAPLVMEDVEFKRMQRLEVLSPDIATAADGSGWVSLNETLNLDLSPPRRRETSSRTDRHDSSGLSPSKAGNNLDLSPPRRRLTSTRTGQHDSSESSPPRTGKNLGLSPPRRSRTSSRIIEHDEDDTDLSIKRRFNLDDSDSRGLQKQKRKESMADGTAAGLQSGRQLVKEMEKKKQNDSTRLKEVDISISGRHANTVYRDKHGKRLEGVDEILKLQQAEEPKKEEKPLEWGRGLVQKREAEARYAELEAEKKKPFARARDDPDLDKALKEQIRWGDPMAHMVKKKIGEPVLLDLGASELMKESGFIVPQAIPKHSWLKRGVTPHPNRYGIKPGRHWDGVDRSTGYERDMYKRQNEKAAEQVEAYLWSVADM